MSQQKSMKESKEHPVTTTIEQSTQAADEIINSLPKEKRLVVTQRIQAIEQEAFSGPLPHPTILQGYEDVNNGFAERILVMAEKEQQHRFNCDTLMVKGTIAESKRGQLFALLISTLFLGGAIWLGLEGHDWLAGGLGGGTLVSIVTILITGQKGNKKSHEAKGEN